MIYASNLVLRYMSDSMIYSRQSMPNSYNNHVAAVDPSRIQSLLGMICCHFHCVQSVLAQACSYQSPVDTPQGSSYSASYLDSLSRELAAKSPNPDCTSSLANSIYESLFDYVHQGGPLPSPLPSSSNSSVLLFVDGLDFNYQLTDEDLVKVFGRFGTIANVAVSQDGTNAVVTLGSQLQATRAVAELNGQQLAGLPTGCLRVIPYTWGSASNASVPIIRKYTCRFDIQIDNDKDFHVARRIIGQKGSNMKRIVKQAGFDAKLRLRGRGSGFLEGAQKQESQEPLHLCVSCKDYIGYRSAVDQVEELLGEIYLEYKEFCHMKGMGASAKHLTVVMQEHPLMFQPTAATAASYMPTGGESPMHMPAVMLSPPMTPGSPIPPPVTVENYPPVMNDKESNEIEKLIEQRNEARRVCNFKEADRIRDVLRLRGIGLMDEPGGRGRGTEVTSWRFWR